MAKKSTRYIVQAAAIAALYAVLTILQNTLLPGSASMAVQFRVSEVLTVLAVFTPAAIPGLTVGCVIANISSLSSLGPYDLIFGSLASLAAALLMYALRNVRWFSLPVPAALMPALANGILVGFEIEFFFVEGGFHFGDFLLMGVLVTLGELGVLLILGLPFAKLIEKQALDKKLLAL
ncbi:MAG: QueT transporter family protein [Clostridiales bacterium]|nr:QueT transporter family protein [Clostridiales bacterium]